MTMNDSQTPNSLTREQRRQQFVRSGWLVSIPLTVVPAHWLVDGEARLDAGYYDYEAAAALRLVHDCGCDVQSLKQTVKDIFLLGRFRRIYATNTKAGWPYLGASEAFQFRPSSDRWIAQDHAPKEAQQHFVKQGWMLVSASGTVGRVVIVTRRLETYFLTHDLLRIMPEQFPYVGYLYAFLSTWLGQALITRDQYGSAIKHLEPHHLANVPIPILPEADQQTIHDQIMRAYALRDEANDLLDEADELLHSSLGLPRFDESLATYLPAPAPISATRLPMPHPRAFTVNATSLADRFDASYHVPVVQTAIALLTAGVHSPTTLGSMVESIFIPPRFKRIYVPKEYGVPFLQGSHLPQMQPNDLKYLSSTQQKGLERWVIRKNWVLVTCSGTIGRVGLTSTQKDKWAASQHLLRIVPDPSKGHPGYIAAFLATSYGQHQLTSKIYGGVVDELTEGDTRTVIIPAAPLDVQKAIGERVVAAYEKKDEASAIEEATIRKLEARLQKSE